MSATLRPFQTRFRCASGCPCLRLATDINSLAHSPKGTPSECLTTSLRPLVSIRFQILFHSPRRGSFHLSLTVLVRYRSSSVFSLGWWTTQLPTELACSVVLRRFLVAFPFGYGTLTPFGRPSQTVPLPFQPLSGSPTTPVEFPPVWAAPLSLATTRGILSFPQVTEMFQFTWFPSLAG